MHDEQQESKSTLEERESEKTREKKSWSVPQLFHRCMLGYKQNKGHRVKKATLKHVPKHEGGIKLSTRMHIQVLLRTMASQVVTELVTKGTHIDNTNFSHFEHNYTQGPTHTDQCVQQQ